MKRFIYRQLMDYKWHLLDQAHSWSRINTPYSPRNKSISRKVRALHSRAEFVSKIAWKYFV